GSFHDGHRSEDLRALTFSDRSFDIFITSDVLEHLFEPEKALREIARVLKPGGMHIFTTPWYSNYPKSVQRAAPRPDGSADHLLPPVYHGNPISDEGSLVTYDWGLDLPHFIFEHSGMQTITYLERDRAKGLDAD